MPTLGSVIGAFLASKEFDQATVSRLAYWYDVFGDRELADITADDVDLAVVRLAERGRLRPVRNGDTTQAGKPLAGSTINRYITQLGSLYKYARRLRLLPRNHVPPTQGIEKTPELPDPDKYLRPEEVERLLVVAKILDRRWGRMSALIIVAFHTGLRKGNLLDLRWRDINLLERTASVLKTKNGRPQVSALSDRAVQALAKLPGKHPDTLVFESTTGQAYHVRRLWLKICIEAGLPGRQFHQLRHGCGSAMAAAGINQATIMAVLGHRTLTASARYMHHSTDDKRAAVERVFG